MSVINLRELNRSLANAERQIKYATAVALTKTAVKVKTAEQEEMKAVYDKPKPFTINSVFIKPANKRQREIHSIVGIKDNARRGTPAAKYLAPTIEGGRRGHKKAEGKLKGAGVLPSGYYIVPGEGLRLNRFGNITKGQIKKALSAGEPGSKFFVSNGRHPRTMHLSKGVWQRAANGRRIKPFIMFVRRPSYRTQFDFFQVANNKARSIIGDEFSRAIASAFR